jgi:hypothetical protein
MINFLFLIIGIAIGFIPAILKNKYENDNLIDYQDELNNSFISINKRINSMVMTINMIESKMEKIRNDFYKNNEDVNT